jgi:hypothetical protein
MIYTKIQNNKGYTLLFAVLVSSLVLSVGISILNVNKKEFLLASSARESTSAFYAADSALECAAYYDLVDNRFEIPSYPSYVSCAGNSPRISDAGLQYVNDGTVATSIFDIKLTETSCATVTVRKSDTETSIQSRGYNIGWNSTDNKCNLPSPRRVERALYYTY